MDGLFTLIGLSLLMGVVSFVVGSLPLTFTLSSSQLRLISALGMGLLVGTSLIVIIPEGVETLYSSSLEPHKHRRRDFAAHGIDVRWEHAPSPPLLRRAEPDEDFAELPPTSDEPSIEIKKDESSESPADQEGDTKDSSGEKGDADEKLPSEEDPDVTKHDTSPHAWVGVGLISGFILMYLVDKIPQFASSSAKQQQRPYHISLDNLGSGLGRASSPSRTPSGLLDFGANARQTGSQAVATTTGLVIHAAADGIALGASTSNAGLSFIIFVAIMVHKAPASFGLTSILLKQGLSNRAARGHLLVFSLAAPVGAIATWLIAHTVMAGHAGDEQNTKWRTGMLLLFSAGTFLYVAMHTMQDNSLEPSRREPSVNGYVDGRDPPQRPKLSLRDLVASTVGMILPLFLQIGHAH